MKRIFIIMILALIPAGLYAQSGLDDFFANYSKTQGYQTIIYGKRMLEMMKEDASPEVKSLLDRIKTIRIVSCEASAAQIMYQAKKKITNGKNKYETISQIHEKGSLSEFYISEETGRSKEVSFVMIASSSQGTAVMEIIGDFDVKDISRLSVIGQKR